MLEKPLVIDLHSSRYLAQAFVVLGGATFLLILILPLPAWFQFLLLILVFVCFLNAYQRDISVVSSTRFIQIIWEDKNQWWLVTQGGQSVKASLSRDSVLWTNLLVLNFYQHENGRRRSLVLLADSASQEQLRFLRVRLKTQLTQMFEDER
ncbi:hypothetical protein MNBD_GAMMA16-634 [hydrothermal vent metagenome]|uniref:Toxin CptA n=1 Tax=hydrothermal vent metagenome TaxID=652676 RepID=A0A3B0Z8K8_9ZZZZ